MKEGDPHKYRRAGPFLYIQDLRRKTQPLYVQDLLPEIPSRRDLTGTNEQYTCDGIKGFCRSFLMKITISRQAGVKLLKKR